MTAHRAIGPSTAASRPPRARLEVDTAGQQRPSGASAHAYDVYRRIGFSGSAPSEGDPTSLVIGLRPVERGWEIGEIKRLLFVAYLVANGCLRP